MADKNKIELIISAVDQTAGIWRASIENADKFRKEIVDVESASSRMGTTLKRVLSIAAGALLVREIGATADEYTLLDNKLKLVTDSTAELAAVQEDLYRAALRSHSEYESSVDLFARLSRATETLGTSQTTLLRITETINKAFLVSGATQMETRNAIIQLSQGLAAGALRGEEFNSVTEQGARVSKMLADYLEVDIGTLRKMAQEGKITTEIMVAAFSRAANQIDDEFGRMQPTIAQAYTDLKTVMGRLISDSNKAGGGTASVATEIRKLADTIDENRDGILSLFSSLISLAGKAVQAIGNIGQSLRGWAAVKSGKLGFWDFATMNADELEKWLKAHESQAQEIQYQINAKIQELAKAEAARATALLAGSQASGMDAYHQRVIAQIEDEIAVLRAAKIQADGYASALSGKKGSAEEPVSANGLDDKKLKQLAKEGIAAAKGITSAWEAQAAERYEVISRTLDDEIAAEQAAANMKKQIAEANWKDIKDTWLLQAEDRAEVQSRALDLLIEKEEEASAHMVKLSERTAEAMEQNFSDFFFSTMRGEFDSFADYVDGVLQSLQRALADYLGQLARAALMGEETTGSGGLVGWAIKGITSLIGSVSSGGPGPIHVGSGGTTAFGMHNGGVAGRDYSFIRTVGAALFSGAPRLHNGLAADEFPAILQLGETVLPKGYQPLMPDISTPLARVADAIGALADRSSGGVDLGNMLSGLSGNLFGELRPINVYNYSGADVSVSRGASSDDVIIRKAVAAVAADMRSGGATSAGVGAAVVRNLKSRTEMRQAIMRTT